MRRMTIGEWVLITDRESSDVLLMVTRNGCKRSAGDQISYNGVLRYVTSKEATPVELPIREDSLMMREIRRLPRQGTGPIIISEASGKPWYPAEFRRNPAKPSAACGIPEVKNRTSWVMGATTRTTNERGRLSWRPLCISVVVLCGVECSPRIRASLIVGCTSARPEISVGVLQSDLALMVDRKPALLRLHSCVSMTDFPNRPVVSSQQ